MNRTSRSRLPCVVPRPPIYARVLPTSRGVRSRIRSTQSSLCGTPRGSLPGYPSLPPNRPTGTPLKHAKAGRGRGRPTRVVFIHVCPLPAHPQEAYGVVCLPPSWIHPDGRSPCTTAAHNHRSSTSPRPKVHLPFPDRAESARVIVFSDRAVRIGVRPNAGMAAASRRGCRLWPHSWTCRFHGLIERMPAMSATSPIHPRGDACAASVSNQNVCQ